VDRFLRELEAAIDRMTEAERVRAVDALKGIVRCVPGLAMLKGISKVAFVGLLGSLGLSLSSDRTPEDWLRKVTKRASEMDLRRVSALLQALS